MIKEFSCPVGAIRSQNVPGNYFWAGFIPPQPQQPQEIAATSLNMTREEALYDARKISTPIHSFTRWAVRGLKWNLR